MGNRNDVSRLPVSVGDVFGKLKHEWVYCFYSSQLLVECHTDNIR
jgi:hypothetical protein